MTLKLDPAKFLESAGFTPRYVALICMSRQRIDRTLHTADRREYMRRHVRLYQRAARYAERGRGDGHSL